ncbi:MAG TPA: hypothetical protein VNZ44_19675 [Pyrinomonadaceae bacterium]|nr:hypothetical protein [Pyrinomonadaceae bacterium]
MEIKTVTYKKMLGSYYLQEWLSNQKMEEHIAKMLQDGWEIMSGPMPGAKERPRGIGLPGDTMIVVYKKG